MTQPIYEPGALDTFLAPVGRLSVPVLLGILPLQSFRHAEFLQMKYTRSQIPQRVRDRM